MTRLSSASIRLVQKMNRMRSDGTYPVYIVVSFHGRRELSCGVSVEKRFWDARREEVRRGCPNAPVLNRMLSEIKQRVIERRNWYEYHGKAYTPSLLLDDVGLDFGGRSNVFKDVMSQLCDERGLKHKTRLHYEYCHRKLSEYMHRDDFLVDEITLSVVKGFLGGLDLCDGSKRDLCGSIASVWNYAIGKGLVSSSDYPFREWRFLRELRQKCRDYFLEKSHMRRLMDYWLDLVVERDGDMWSYRDGAYDRLGDRNSEEFGILWFLLMYKLNGSAPIEVTKLRCSDCRRVSIGGADYWALDFKRQKTGTSVQVRWRRGMFSVIGLEHFLGRSLGGYVYPIRMSTTADDYKMLKDSWHCSEKAIGWVRRAFQRINGDISRDNAEKGLGEPLVDVSRVVMYTARHSFACHYLNSEGATVAGLASLMSRSPNTISTYIHQLTSDAEIASMTDGLVI